MRFALMIEPQQGLSYADQLAVARHAEAAGFETLFRSDHYESFPGPADRPTTDAWAVLAGLARETTHDRPRGARLAGRATGCPGNLAKLVATVDEMSGGRLEFGLGAGWHEEEHRRHGFPFPPIEDRATMLEEQLDDHRRAPRTARTASRSAAASTRSRTPGSAARPTRRINVLVGGERDARARCGSPRRTPTSSTSRARLRSVALDKFGQLDDGVPGRRPRPGHARPLGDGRDARSAGTTPRWSGGSTRSSSCSAGDPDDGPGAARSDAWLAERRTRWIIGTPDEARARIRQYANAGCERIMLQDFLPWDLDMIDLMGEELVGRV